MMKEFPSFIFIDDTSIEITYTENVIRIEMSNGMAKTKPMQSEPTMNLTFAISIHRGDMDSFNSWFKDIKFGDLWFLMRSPIDGMMKKYRLLSTELRWRKMGNLFTSTMRLESYNG